MSPRFHIFVSDVNQETRRWSEFKIFLRDSIGMERLSLDLPQDVDQFNLCKVRLFSCCHIFNFISFRFPLSF